MTKFPVTTAALVAFAAVGVARAADLPPPPPLYKAPPPMMLGWTGCYLGGGGGYGMWNQDVSATTPAGVTATTTSGGRGWFGTLQGGCDYQISPRIVLGAFIDGDFSDLSSTVLIPPGATASEKESSAWAIGARAGWLVTPGLLGYVSGGFTQANFDQLNFAGPAFPGGFVASHTYDGWFLGTGYEYALDFLPWPGIFWKTEYRYSSYGSDDLPVIGFPATINSQKAIQTIRTEIVWRFNFWGFGGPY